MWTLYEGNCVREMHFRADQHAAVLVLEARSVEEARQRLAHLHLVRHGLIAFDLISLAPHPGIERLFAE